MVELERLQIFYSNPMEGIKTRTQMAIQEQSQEKSPSTAYEVNKRLVICSGIRKNFVQGTGPKG